MMVLAGVPMVTVCRHGGWATFEAFWGAYAHTFAPENVTAKVARYVQHSSQPVTHPWATWTDDVRKKNSMVNVI